MSEKNISILEAAELSGKSVQTIRRALKSKKIKFRRRSTPQGFNYLINKDSLCAFYKIMDREEKILERKTQKIKLATPKINDEIMAVEVNDFKTFVKMMEKLINNHTEERQNFLRLVDTLQEKVFVLENQLNLLKGPALTGNTKWYQFWK